MYVIDWDDAVVEVIELSGSVRFDFGARGHLLIFSGFELKSEKHVYQASEPSDLEEVAVELVALRGQIVRDAEISALGVLSVGFASTRLVVRPIVDGEAFSLRQSQTPTVIVCGFGGEVFTWA